MSESEKKRAVRTGSPRSAARLAAVQALYQIDLTGSTGQQTIAQFVQFYLGQEIDGDEYLAPDEVLFRELVTGTLAQKDTLDQHILGCLTAEWPLDRLETILRAILRVATFELACRADVPARVVIAEYVDIAHAFFTGREPGLINGVLDRLGRTLRTDEWQALHGVKKGDATV